LKYKFYVNDVPDPYPIWRWVRDHTDVDTHIKNLKPSIDDKNLLTLDHKFDTLQIIDAVLDSVKNYGFKGWRSSLGEAKHYGGLSLTYNPKYSEDCDPNQQTLGTDKNSPSQFFYGHVENFKTVRNTYFDSYGFRKLAPCVDNTKLKDIVNGFKRSLIRSRIGIINAEHVSDTIRSSMGWHRDETVFENLRINIPIQTDEIFMFELENHGPEHLKLGEMYSWDTNIPHRVFPIATSFKSRIHLVFGFSPWFDYLPEEDAYVSNEFYGEMHPMDMLINGHVHEKIVGIK
jgi:hypothetical protein